MRRALAAMTAVVIAGCAQPSAMPDFAPFNELAGVNLGMKAADLAIARPKAFLAGYVGYQEIVGGQRVEYHFPGSYSEEQAPPARSRLRGVALVEDAPSDSAAEVLWRSRVQQAAAALDRSPACNEFDTSFTRGLFANVGAVTVTLHYRQTRPRVSPASVKTQVAGITSARLRKGRVIAC